MVEGIESFREKFRAYPDCYTIIGGAACDILMSQHDMTFRATKDIDMILILEDSYLDFAKTFWGYIREAGYKCGWKNSEKTHFYRFTDPKPGYPKMIELFSRKPGYRIDDVEGIIPIYIDDDTSSLSAILLNDDFYHFMMRGRKVVDGVSILDAQYLIPFKMYAWLELEKKKDNGQHVNEKDIKKHKYDVFRLLQIVQDDVRVETEGEVKESIKKFFELIMEEELPLEQMGIPFGKAEGIEMLEHIYLRDF